MELIEKKTLIFNFPKQGFNFQVLADDKRTGLTDLFERLQQVMAEIQTELNKSKSTSSN